MNCLQLGEAKKIYPKHFVSKISDALGEEYETEIWIDFARNHNYMDEYQHQKLTAHYDEIRKLLIFMMNNPDKFCK